MHRGSASAGWGAILIGLTLVGSKEGMTQRLSMSIHHQLDAGFKGDITSHVTNFRLGENGMRTLKECWIFASRSGRTPARDITIRKWQMG
jgi:hypothetical protein